MQKKNTDSWEQITFISFISKVRHDETIWWIRYFNTIIAVLQCDQKQCDFCIARHVIRDATDTPLGIP